MPAATPETGSSNTYFATLTDTGRLGAELMERVRLHREHVRNTGALTRIQDSFAMYQGKDRDGQGWNTRRVQRSGKSGSVVKVKANHYGSLIRAIVTLTSAQKPAMQPKARNSDASNQSNAILAGDLLEDYIVNQGVWEALKVVVSHASKYRAGYILKLWNRAAGAPTDPSQYENPEPVLVRNPPDHPTAPGEVVGTIPEGAHEFHNLTPLDVAFDINVPTWRQSQWAICRVLMNRWDLAAQQTDPALAAKIRNFQADTGELDFRLDYFADPQRSAFSKDIIPVRWFFHAKTQAVPNGRQVCFLSDDIVLEAGDLEYKRVPVFQLTPEALDGAADGHSPTWDLQALQEANDASLSAALTKAQFLPAMGVSKAGNINKKDLGTPWVILEVDKPEDMPHVMDFTVDPTPNVKLGEFFQGQMETVSGINAVSRGNADALGKGAPAQLAALVQAQAVMANSSLQGNYQKLVGDLGTAIIEDLQVFSAQIRRKLTSVAGKSRSQMVRYFSGSDLADIDSVTVESGNPITRDIAGRMQMVQLLKSEGVQLDPDRIVALIETGRWTPIIEDVQNEQNQIREENEALSQGKPVPDAIVGEDQIKHILGHTPHTLSDKSQPDILQLRLAHIQSHLKLIPWPLLPPDIGARLVTLGFAPPPPPMPMGPPPGPPGAPGMVGPPPPGAGPSQTPPPQHGRPSGTPAPSPSDSPVQMQNAPHLPGLPRMPNGEPTPVPGVNT